MESFSKLIRGICAIPLIGGFLTLLLGILPILLVSPFWNSESKDLAVAGGAILVAAWCYFLGKMKIVNIVTPVIPVPLWSVAILSSIVVLYQHFTAPLILQLSDRRSLPGNLLAKEFSDVKKKQTNIDVALLYANIHRYDYEQ